MPTGRLNTQVAYIPFLSTQVGPNVLRATEYEKNFVVRAKYVSPSHQDQDIGIPTPIYGENILPMTNGWESVTFTERIKPHKTFRGFNQLINLKSGTETNILYSPAQGKDFVNYDGQWAQGPSYENFAGLVTYAYLKLKTYVFYQRHRIMSYNYANKAFHGEALNGLQLTNIDGITTSNNLLIAWNETTIFWSSAIDPLDFVPSLSSGAGSQNPTQARGKIVCCLPAAGGFIIYTTANAIFAIWSGNLRYPWNFVEIPGSAGIRSPEHVSYDANYDGHFAWTPVGLQMVTRGKAESALPEVTDFLTGKLVEEFIGISGYHPHTNNSKVFNSQTQDWISKVQGPSLLQQITLTEDPWVKVALIGSRYLCISYGYKAKGIYDWVIVYDYSIQRYGKLRVTHTDLFEYITQTYEQPQVKTMIGILKADGSVYTVDFAHGIYGEGILLYGRIQESNGRWIEVSEISIQSLRDVNPRLFIIPSYDGVNLENAAVPVQTIDTKNLSQWMTRVAGQNVNFLISGTFSVTSITLEFNVLGSR